MKQLFTLHLLILIGVAGVQSSFGQASTSDETAAAVMKAEEAFRLAKLQNNTAALGKLLADEYVGVNQYGARRDKASVIELFAEFKLTSLTPQSNQVRLAGDIAIVTGTQIEVNPGGKENLAFTRVWVKRGGNWLLIANTQMIPNNPG
jgi:hypothetical protein